MGSEERGMGVGVVVGVGAGAVRVVLGTHSSDETTGVFGAVVDVDQVFLSRVKQLAGLCSDENLARLVVSGSPHAWLPEGAAQEGRFNLPEMDVSSDGMWFRDHPKHSDGSVETQWVSIAQLEQLLGDHAGKTVQLQDSTAKVLAEGVLSFDEIDEAINGAENEEVAI